MLHVKLEIPQHKKIDEIFLAFPMHMEKIWKT